MEKGFAFSRQAWTVKAINQNALDGNTDTWIELNEVNTWWQVNYHFAGNPNCTLTVQSDGFQSRTDGFLHQRPEQCL